MENELHPIKFTYYSEILCVSLEDPIKIEYKTRLSDVIAIQYPEGCSNNGNVIIIKLREKKRKYLILFCTKNQWSN